MRRHCEMQKIISITFIVSLILLCSCESETGGNNTDKPVTNKEDIASISPVTIAPTNPTTKGEDKSDDNKRADALPVIKDYFIALKEHKTKDPSQYCTDHLNNGSYSNIKDAKLIEIKDDIENKWKIAYSLNRGTITNPYDVICFEVTYDMQNVDDNRSSEPSGVVTKWFTLIKETETSPWLIDEIGY